MKFSYVSGRRCLDFAGTLRHRGSAQVEELLTDPDRLSEWAVQAGLVDAAITVTEDELAAAIDLREAIYRVVIARLEHRPLDVVDVDLLNGRASQPRLTPRLDPVGSISRDGTLSELLASWPPICLTSSLEVTSKTSKVAPTRSARASTSTPREGRTGIGAAW